MPVIQLEAQLSSAQLLQAVELMPSEELDEFVERILLLHAQRSATHLKHTESELLLQINRGIPPELRERYEALSAKRQAETLNSEEYAELLRLTGQVEQLDAMRLSGETVPLFHPRRQYWDDHFTWNDAYTLILGLSLSGRVTVEALKLTTLQSLLGQTRAGRQAAYPITIWDSLPR